MRHRFVEVDDDLGIGTINTPKPPSATPTNRHSRAPPTSNCSNAARAQRFDASDDWLLLDAHPASLVPIYVTRCCLVTCLRVGPPLDRLTLTPVPLTRHVSESIPLMISSPIRTPFSSPTALAHAPFRFLRRLLGVLTAVVLCVMSFTQPVSAHSDLESSTPAKDSTATESVTSITLVFAKPVVTTSESFVVVTADGAETPVVGQSSDSRTFVLPLASALPNGSTTVRFSVVATSDAHAIADELSFTVNVAAPATTAATPTTVATAAPAATSPVADSPAAEPVVTSPAAPVSVPESVFITPTTAPGQTPLAAVSTVPGTGDTGTTAVILVLVAALGLGVIGAKVLPGRSRAA